MDTDDISKPERFEKQIRVFNENPQIDVVGSWIDEFDDTPDNIISIRTLPETHEQLVKYSKSRCPLNHPAVMYKKSKVMKCGGYELLGFLDDYLLWMKMLQGGATFYNIQESLVFYRSGNIYERRGGLKYAIDTCKLHWICYKRRMINLPTALKNMFIWFLVKISPVQFRKFFYEKFLRQKKSYIL
jgi:hypothetical protein